METYEKVTDDVLRITDNDTHIHTFEVSRAEIQTQLDHLRLDADKMEIDFKSRIEALEAKITILDS